MPKERRLSLLASNRSRSSPYAYSSENANQHKSQYPSPTAEDFKSWEEARCPICMEHPHNAVMIRCSCYEKGCRPFMCDTSSRLSNCLDQFCKSSKSAPSMVRFQDAPSERAISHLTLDELLLPGQTGPDNDQLQPRLTCPLCRGEIYGWYVVEPARQFMNSKTRSCSCETCDFSGNYSEIRKHARSAHPLIRPSEVDPERQHEWTQLQHESNLNDLLSMINPLSDVRENNIFSLSEVGLDIDFEVGIDSDVEVEEVEAGEEEIDILSAGDSIEFICTMQFIEFVPMSVVTMPGPITAIGMPRNMRLGYDMETSHANAQNNSFRQNNSLRGNLSDRMPTPLTGIGMPRNMRLGHDMETSHANAQNNSFRQNNSLRGNLSDRMPTPLTGIGSSRNMRLGYDMETSHTNAQNNSFRQNNSLSGNLSERMPTPMTGIGSSRNMRLGYDMETSHAHAQNNSFRQNSSFRGNLLGRMPSAMTGIRMSRDVRVGYDMEASHANRQNNGFTQNISFTGNFSERMPSNWTNFRHNNNLSSSLYFRQNDNFWDNHSVGRDDWLYNNTRQNNSLQRGNPQERMPHIQHPRQPPYN